MGLQAERAALEKLATHIIHQEQTVNPQEAEVEETKPDPESDTVPIAPEPDLTQDHLQTDTQDRDQKTPESSTLEPVPAQHQVSTDAPAPAGILSDSPAANPSLDSNPATSPAEAENTPTSQSAGSTRSGAVRVASAGDELPVDNFVFAQHSDSQCGVNPPELATCESSPFGSTFLSVDDAGTDDLQSDQSPSSGLEVEVQSTPGHVDQEQQQNPELEDGLSDLDRKGNVSHLHQEQQTRDVSIVKETDPSVPSKEDIPTFDEWKKQVMEVEKEKSQSLHTSTSGTPHPVKKVQKNFKNNYASVECGAKILSANNEAKSTSAILMENMDLYMLNPCSNKIWFVIELCEPIQVKQLDIANFELFSSTPKDFLVSISDRYPTNKWVKLGTFHARDERIVQSFPLDEQLYAKYVKVELLSHFGSEHFCPLSLIRVFGTSMVEEYEEIADSQYPSERLEYLDEDYGKMVTCPNSFSTLAAKCPTLQNEQKMIFNNKYENTFILEPAEPQHPATQEDSNVSNDSSVPSLTASDSPNDRQIVTLVEEEEDEEPRQSTVTLMEEEGEEEEEEDEERRDAERNQWESQTYCPFSSFSSLSLSCMATLQELLHRWCSARLAKERLHSLRRRQLRTQTQTVPDANSPVLTHTTSQIPAPVPTSVQEALPLTENPPEPKVPAKGQNEGPLGEVHVTHTPDAHTPEPNVLLEPSRISTIPPHSFSDIHSSLTWPTPTHEEKPLHLIKDAVLDPVPTPPLQAIAIPETEQASSITPTLSHGEQVDSLTQTGESQQVEDMVDEDVLSTNGNGNVHRTATDFYAELQNGGEYNSGAVNGNTVNGAAVHGSNQKESVFMRLNNRIKALEMNMSLSSRYLEELSQRYRKQMEEMQRAFNKTIIKLQNTSRIAEEQDQKQTDSIQVLQSQLENVTRLMLNLTTTVSQLQREVSDRQSYLVVSLVLCLSLGLLLCLQCCCGSSPSPNTTAVALPKSSHYPSPKRCFSSYDDMSLNRRVTCPLVRSKSFHLSSTEVGPDDLYIVEPLRFSPEKKVQCLFRPLLLAVTAEVSSLPTCTPKEFPSETSSSSSSTHSEESFTSRLPPPSPIFPPIGLCNGHSLNYPLHQPPTKSRHEKRSMKRRKSRQAELQFPHMPTGGVGSLPTLQQLMKGNKEISVGTIGVTAVTGHV
uniref:SUN domain containing ossification factor n=1 Tax=Mastacembelus armatus TaxID=205130 RepID=A0A7N8XJ35_9TELE